MANKNRLNNVIFYNYLADPWKEGKHVAWAFARTNHLFFSPFRKVGLYLEKNSRLSYKYRFVSNIIAQYIYTIKRHVKLYSLFLLFFKKLLNTSFYRENSIYFKKIKLKSLFKKKDRNINREKNRKSNKRINKRKNNNIKYKIHIYLWYKKWFRKKYKKQRRALWKSFHRVSNVFWGNLLKRRIKSFIFWMFKSKQQKSNFFLKTSNEIANKLYFFIKRKKQKKNWRNKHRKYNINIGEPLSIQKIKYKYHFQNNQNFFPIYNKNILLFNNLSNAENFFYLQNNSLNSIFLCFPKIHLFFINYNYLFYFLGLKNKILFPINKNTVFLNKNKIKSVNDSIIDFYHHLSKIYKNRDIIKVKNRLIRTGVLSKKKTFSKLQHGKYISIFLHWFDMFLRKHMVSSKFIIYGLIRKINTPKLVINKYNFFVDVVLFSSNLFFFLKNSKVNINDNKIIINKHTNKKITLFNFFLKRKNIEEPILKKKIVHNKKWYKSVVYNKYNRHANRRRFYYPFPVLKKNKENNKRITIKVLRKRTRKFKKLYSLINILIARKIKSKQLKNKKRLHNENPKRYKYPERKKTKKKLREERLEKLRLKFLKKKKYIIIKKNKKLKNLLTIKSRINVFYKKKNKKKKINKFKLLIRALLKKKNNIIYKKLRNKNLSIAYKNNNKIFKVLRNIKNSNLKKIVKYNHKKLYHFRIHKKKLDRDSIINNKFNLYLRYKKKRRHFLKKYKRKLRGKLYFESQILPQIKEKKKKRYKKRKLFFDQKKNKKNRKELTKHVLIKFKSIFEKEKEKKIKIYSKIKKYPNLRSYRSEILSDFFYRFDSSNKLNSKFVVGILKLDDIIIRLFKLIKFNLIKKNKLKIRKFINLFFYIKNLLERKKRKIKTIKVDNLEVYKLSFYTVNKYKLTFRALDIFIKKINDFHSILKKKKILNVIKLYKVRNYFTIFLKKYKTFNFLGNFKKIKLCRKIIAFYKGKVKKYNNFGKYFNKNTKIFINKKKKKKIKKKKRFKSLLNYIKYRRKGKFKFSRKKYQRKFYGKIFRYHLINKEIIIHFIFRLKNKFQNINRIKFKNLKHRIRAVQGNLQKNILSQESYLRFIRNERYLIDNLYILSMYYNNIYSKSLGSYYDWCSLEYSKRYFFHWLHRSESIMDNSYVFKHYSIKFE